MLCEKKKDSEENNTKRTVTAYHINQQTNHITNQTTEHPANQRQTKQLHSKRE